MQFMKKKTRIGKKTNMNKFDVLTCVEDKRWKIALGDVEDVVEACKNAVVKTVQKDVWFLDKPKNFSVNLNLSDDEAIKALNKEFRGIDKPTNVLSFANVDDDFFEETLQEQEDVCLGDVMIAYETMKEQASELEISLHSHFCHLWVHGMLHILGYDHIKEDERLEMEEKEIEVLRALNIENPYQE